MPARARGLAARAPSMESLFVATFTLLGLRLGLRRLGDNSLFLHVRTGIDMVRTGTIPGVDPYSFTARGRPWVVQSWLPETTYGVAHRLYGFTAIRLEHGILYALLAWLLARRARTGSPARTALAAALTLGVGVAYWSPRPLAFGLLAFAVTVTIVEERRSPWLLIPVVWVWVNSHGSFPMGVAWLVLVAVGQRLDGRREAAPPRPPVLPWLAAFMAGLAASLLNPLGPRLLAFPLTLLEKREAFRHVVEWRPLDVGSPTGLFTLAVLLVAAVVLVRTRQRLGWHDLLPAGALVLLGLLAQRNLPVAAVALAPVLGRALQAPEEAASGAATDQAVPHLVLAGLLGALALLFAGGVVREPPLDLQGYPVKALELAREQGPLRRLVTDDVAAGYVILVHGRQSGVFIDDRIDLYPVRVTLDYLQLVQGHPRTLDILDRHGAEVVVWEEKRPLVRTMEGSGAWRRIGTREGWAVLVRARAPAGP